MTTTIVWKAVLDLNQQWTQFQKNSSHHDSFAVSSESIFQKFGQDGIPIWHWESEDRKIVKSLKDSVTRKGKYSHLFLKWPNLLFDELCIGEKAEWREGKDGTESSFVSLTDDSFLSAGLVGKG